MSKPYVISVASGDGIGPEVCAVAMRVLHAVGKRFGHAFDFQEALVGGAAWEACGEHLPAASVATIEKSDALLFGSVGGPVSEQHMPKWKDAERTAILGLRARFRLAINIRPSKVYAELAHLCPLKAEVIGDGVDVVIIRELLGGAYFGRHETAADGRSAVDEMTYTWEQIEHALRFGFITCVVDGRCACEVGMMLSRSKHSLRALGEQPPRCGPTDFSFVSYNPNPNLFPYPQISLPNTPLMICVISVLKAGKRS